MLILPSNSVYACVRNRACMFECCYAGMCAHVSMPIVSFSTLLFMCGVCVRCNFGKIEELEEVSNEFLIIRFLIDFCGNESSASMLYEGEVCG